jgi:NAD(P)-dependent dehydrogenase (short-subunit alcohol dehydrogenase family)
MQTVLITGSSSGIGRDAAEYFARKGWQVAASMRSPEKHADWARRHNIFTPKIDVDNHESIHAGVQAVLDKFGKIDVLINNAGYALYGPIEALEPDAMEAQFRTNVLGLTEMTRTVIPNMRERKSGTIVNISSIGGRMVFPFGSAYHATKFAVEGLSETMAIELRPFGIKVKLVEPGGIDTGFAAALQIKPHPAYDKMIAGMMKQFEGLKLPKADAVSPVIYRAATSKSRRLRFLAKPGVFPYVRMFFSDGSWQWLMGKVLGQ